MGRVTPREWAWVSVFAAVVMLVTTVPYWVAWSSQTPDLRFGGFVWGVEDGNSYIAKMNAGANGAWLFTLPYTSEPQTGVFIYSFYLTLGRLAGGGHDRLVAVYHIARWVCGFALLLVSYRFLAEFLLRIKQRRLAVVITALGGGLGWALMFLFPAGVFDSLPIDVISPEAFTFLNLYGLPHLAFARCFLLLGLLAYWQDHPYWAGAWLFAVSLIQPLYVLIAWALLVGDQFVGAWRTMPASLSLITGRLWPTLLLSSPVVLYTIYIFIADPLIQQWNVQNVLPSPHPLHYVFGYGVLLGVGAWGWRGLWRRRPRLARFVSLWVCAAPFLLYAPIATQRRLIEGFQLPLVVLATLALTVTFRRYRRWLIPLSVGAIIPTSVLLLVTGSLSALAHNPLMFHTQDELATFDWLARQGAAGQVVLSSRETGNVLPAYTPQIAYIGHGPETLFIAGKAPRVAAFYQAVTADDERRQLLAEGHIAYVLFGPHEHALGDFDPQKVPYLRLEFTAGEYKVYIVE